VISSDYLLAKISPPSLDSILDFNPSQEDGFLNPSVSASSNLQSHWLFTNAIPDWIQYLLTLAAGVAVLSIVLAGLMLIWHAEEEEYKQKAYQTITYSLFGLIISSLSYSIIEIINKIPTLGTNPSTDINIDTGSGIENLVQGELLTEIIPEIIKIILQLVGTFAFGMILYAGILMITRDSEDGKVKKAKTILIYSLIGTIVSLFAYIAVDAILLLNFER